MFKPIGRLILFKTSLEINGVCGNLDNHFYVNFDAFSGFFYVGFLSNAQIVYKHDELLSDFIFSLLIGCTLVRLCILFSHWLYSCQTLYSLFSLAVLL